NSIGCIRSCAMTKYAKLGKNIADLLEGKCVGFGIAIYHHLDLEWSTGWGSAVLNPQTKMTSKSRMGVMSMSKTITATAVVKQIAKLSDAGQDISIDSPIAPFLPSQWVRGPNVNNLTFRHLMTHTSGLAPTTTADPDADVYENLQATIASGTPGVLAQPLYHNLHYCLFR